MKIILLLIMVIVACTAQPQGPYAQIGEETINLEIANTEEQKRLGLMYREQLEEGAGMLFVYDNEQPLSVWMKNTLIPLDVLFLTKNGTIVDIATLEPCEKEQCPIYTSSRPAKYFLEVNKGFVMENNLTVGNSVDLKLGNI